MVTPGRFLSCDWGTSSLRLRWVDFASCTVLAEHTSGMGIRRTHEAWERAGGERVGFYAGILTDALDALRAVTPEEIRDADLVISGMASSSLGILELPYATLPFRLDGEGVAYRALGVPLPGGIRPWVISGVRAAADVIRGEETQLIGLAQLDPGVPGEAVLLLPGTHCKHVYVSGGAVVGFRTYMTGEIFETVAQHTVLRTSVDGSAGSDLDHKAFQDGARAGESEPLLHGLFGVRAAALLGQREPAANFWYLSGLLVGAELASLRVSGAPSIVLCADRSLSEAYALGLATLGLADGLVVIPPDDVARSVVLGHRSLLRVLRAPGPSGAGR